MKTFSALGLKPQAPVKEKEKEKEKKKEERKGKGRKEEEKFFCPERCRCSEG